VLTAVATVFLAFVPAALAGPGGPTPSTLATLAIQQAALTAGDGACGDYFGCSVSLDGDTALVGAPYKTVGANTNQGAAYLFTRSGTTWTQQQELTAGDGARGDYFGWSVSLDGDTALVGARYNTVGANTYQGAAYLFTRSGTTWTQQQELTAADGTAYDFFGYSVALDGESVLVGACNKTVGTRTIQGAAYVFTRDGTTWTQQQKLTAADGAAGDYFGWSVSLDGDTALVGAYKRTVGANTSQGAAYLFTRSGTTWTQQQELTAGDGAAGDCFGCSVSLDGDTALVGALYKTVGANTYQGAAYLFTRSGTTWTQQQELIAGDGAAGDYFGWSVSLDGDTALVGAYNKTVGANTRQGAAYVFVGLDITVTSPAGLNIWAKGDAVTVSWSVTAIPPTGQFGVWVTDGAFYNHLFKLVKAPGASRTYSTSFSLGVPAGGPYRFTVNYRPVVGAGDFFVAANSPGTFTVVDPANITVTAPTAASHWLAGSSQTVSWSLKTAVGSGQFVVWLIGPDNVWRIARPVAPVAGRLSYSTTFPANVPGGSGYRAAVYWRSTVGSGSYYAMRTKSDPFLITAVSITSPTATSRWATGSTQTISWTVTPALPGGQFYVALVGSAGTWLVSRYVPAVALQTAYSSSGRLTAVPAGTYTARVYWRPTLGGGAYVLQQRSASFAVTP
jgi:hypothetical protein